MWPFKEKKVKKIEGPVWGHLVREHEMDVDTLSKMRCVKKDAVKENQQPVTRLRIFKPEKAEEKGIEVTGWKTFDENPELIHFEGYVEKATRKVHMDDRTD